MFLFLFILKRQRGLNQLQHLSGPGHHDSDHHLKERSIPLTFQGLRTNPIDGEFHAVFFDAEALIGEFLLSIEANLIILF